MVDLIDLLLGLVVGLSISLIIAGLIVGASLFYAYKDVPAPPPRRKSVEAPEKTKKELEHVA
jgi:hypothetical protein